MEAGRRANIKGDINIKEKMRGKSVEILLPILVLVILLLLFSPSIAHADAENMTTTYNVTVVEPDLKITEKWVNWPECHQPDINCTIYYNVTNIGEGTAHKCHNTTLYVDGVEVAHDHVPVDLSPGENYTGCFDDYIWTYTSPSDNITVCADNDNTVHESNETNNCLTNIWVCGDVDGNGFVTPYDAYLAFIDDIRSSEWAADVDCSGYLTPYDAYLLFTANLNCCCK